MSFTSLTGTGRSDSNKKKVFFDVKNSQVIFYAGKRKAGKDYVLEKCVTVAHDNGITSMHGWSARSMENAFYAYNNHCESKWEFTKNFLNLLVETKDGIRDRQTMMQLTDLHNDKMFDFFINEFLKESWIRTKDNMIGITNKGYDILKDPPLRCHCKKAYPILIFVSNVFTISPTSIEEYNRKQAKFWDYKEYHEALMKGLVKGCLPKDVNYWNIDKPPKMQRELVKIFYFNSPTPKKTDQFASQFKQYMLQLRSEHRIGVQSPQLLSNKFFTLAAEINALPDIMTSREFEHLTEEEVGKPEYMWDKWQRNHDRFLLALSELKTIAPSQKMSGEVLSTEAKRALFDKVGEWRHWNMHLLGSYQNPEDLYAGIRYQADYVVIKRASKNLLGDDFAWLFASVEEKRKQAYNKYGITDETLKDAYWTIDASIHAAVNREYPRIQNLPDDYMIVTDIDNSWYYMKVPFLEHHHKHTNEKFGDIFKLTITRNDKPINETSTDNGSEDEDEKEHDKKTGSHQALMERYAYLFETMQQKRYEIYVELIPVEERQKLSDDENKKASIRLYSSYHYWKQSQTKREISKKFNQQG